MTTQAQPATLPEVARPKKLSKILRAILTFARKNPLGGMGAVMVISVLIMAAGVEVFERYDPLYQDYLDRLLPPGPAHFMGTDEFGRDLWARIVGGSRISVMVGFTAVAFGASLGLVIGIVSGYFGGLTDNIIQRIIEVMLAFPGLLLALALMATLGAGLDKVIIAISVGFVPRTARTMRSTVLSAKENVYVEAARAIGASNNRIMFRHVLPNVTAPFLIIVSGLLGSAILVEATLSFLGLGIPPPFPSWGRMLSSSVASYALTAPWMVIFPGLAITWLVLGFNLFGDALRDVWDPRLRGSQ